MIFLSITALRVTTTSYTIILLINFFFYIKNENHTKIVPLKSLLTSKRGKINLINHQCENNKIAFIVYTYIAAWNNVYMYIGIDRSSLYIASLITTNGRIHCYIGKDIDSNYLYAITKFMVVLYNLQVARGYFFISVAHE